MVAWAALVCAVCAGCGKGIHHKPVKSIYYWKTTWQTDSTTRQKLQDLHMQRMYLRLFDADIAEPGGSPVPVAFLQLRQPLVPGVQYVPVVYITQRALHGLTQGGGAKLGRQIATMVQAWCTDNGVTTDELQLDCDWTQQTRATYFALLQAVRQHPFTKGKILSCTIRLHQIKYAARTGVPAVDKGLLMCYNMGNLKQYGPHNSILDIAEAQKYLATLGAYPLPLDVALPLFSWCIRFHNKQFAGILREVTSTQLAGDALFTQTGPNLFSCGSDTVWHGYPLRSGDEIRTEQSVPDDVLEIAGYTAKHLRNEQVNVILFSCDSLTLSNFNNNELEAIYNTYR
jgi:hypothetical protein